jgi:hypothetical protein
VFAADLPDHEIAWLIDSPSRNFEHVRIIPYLGFNEIDAMLGFVGLAFDFVVLEHGIESIPCSPIF